MINIKITNTFPEIPLEKQTLKSRGVWGNCKFHINSNIKKCDYWVVLDNLPKEESIKCPSNNKILITGEPEIIKTYDTDFLKQFNTIVTCQQNLKHPNKIYQQVLPWNIGYKFGGGAFIESIKDYNKLKNTKPKKEKLISAIISNKTRTKAHKQRLEFIKKLKNHFRDKMDVFGAGINHIPTKWEGIAPYKYHVAIENSIYKYYWTEKFSDTLLGDALPFYYGCPNINDYFPNTSYELIDIFNIKKSIDTIEKAINKNSYEKHINAISEAKNLILDKYNLFAMIHEIVNNKNIGISYIKTILKPEEYYSNKLHKKILRKLINTFK